MLIHLLQVEPLTVPGALLEHLLELLMLLELLFQAFDAEFGPGGDDPLNHLQVFVVYVLCHLLFEGERETADGCQVGRHHILVHDTSITL